MSDQLDLEAIAARAEAATMGPWYADFIRGAGAAVVRPEAICTLAYPHTNLFGRPNWGNGDDRGPSTTKQFFKDVDFVVAARQDVPALVAEVRRLHAENADLKAALAKAAAPTIRLANGEGVHIGFISLPVESVTTVKRPATDEPNPYNEVLAPDYGKWD